MKKVLALNLLRWSQVWVNLRRGRSWGKWDCGSCGGGGGCAGVGVAGCCGEAIPKGRRTAPVFDGIEGQVVGAKRQSYKFEDGCSPLLFKRAVFYAVNTCRSHSPATHLLRPPSACVQRTTHQAPGFLVPLGENGSSRSSCQPLAPTIIGISSDVFAYTSLVIETSGVPTPSFLSRAREAVSHVVFFVLVMRLDHFGVGL